MGKNKKANQFGRSIIRDRFGSKPKPSGDSYLHTSELGDGYDWNRINLRSVTEETSLEEFLATAELAGTEFTAEKLNVKFVSLDSRAGLLSVEEELKIQQTQEEHKQLLRIPRRPAWDAQTTAEELDQSERENFLLWRRELAELQDVEGITMTPFERNLDFWRQLWRVIERSDIIVQIVDGRNPLLFRSEDLEKYVKEVDSTKLNMMLINKADYLTQQQREMWAEYFDEAGLKVAFWSAILEVERLKELNKLEEEAEAEEQISDSEEEESSEESSVDENKDVDQEKCIGNDSDQDSDNDRISETAPGMEHRVESDCDNCTVGGEASGSEITAESTSELAQTDVDSLEKLTVTEKYPSTSSDQKNNSVSSSLEEGKQLKSSDSAGEGGVIVGSNSMAKNDPRVLDGPELIELFQSLHTGKKHTEGVNTIGLVGYPNVGKSSTINALIQTKKVPVSATPGRTKHFQTLFLDPTLMLCDCPGLVMPTFVNTKADMVVHGILPIDQMRDYVPPVSLVCKLIPKLVLEATYGIIIPKPREGEDEGRPPTAHELLSAYGYMRGFMTHKGIPDYQRSARHVLKDFVAGKLLYCLAPPAADIEKFCPTPAPSKPVKERSHPQPQPVGSKTKASVFKSEMDQLFFEKKEPRSGTKGVLGQDSSSTYNSDSVSETSHQRLAEKPWKKHNNKAKKEKLRRIYSHLDA